MMRERQAYSRFSGTSSRSVAFYFGGLCVRWYRNGFCRVSNSIRGCHRTTFPLLRQADLELVNECEAEERVPRLRWGRRRGRWRGQRQTTQRWMGMIQRP